MQLHAGSSLNCGWGSISWHLLQQAVPETPPSCRTATGQQLAPLVDAAMQQQVHCHPL